jgi:peptidoglycan/LPS O-acetylase OafA/YrhL
MQIKQKIDSLTSLRFFAAAMIVIHHSAGMFGLSKDQIPAFLWGQGVSFFFVLSGFILSYVYPKLETWPDIFRFLRARFARVWPGLMVSLFLAWWLLSLNWDSKVAAANILMINAWIPFPIYFFSYNSPSWSVSTEVFFYLAYPFLIYRREKSWLIKMLSSGAIVAALIAVSNLKGLPGYGSLDDGVTRFALLYIHPASRIFEFIFGICVGFYWRKTGGEVQWSKSRSTLYEVIALLLSFAFTSVYCITPLAKWVDSTLGRAAWEWQSGSGSMFVFGLLIYVIAAGRGYVRVWLSHPAMVLLGEISFSIYLLHQIFLRHYETHLSYFSDVPNLLAAFIFSVVLLLASYLMWVFIEIPCRRLILGKMNRSGKLGWCQA